MTLSAELWAAIRVAARNTRRKLTPESGVTVDDICQDAAVIILKAGSKLSHHNPRGLAVSAVRFAFMTATRKERVKENFVFRELAPETSDSLADKRETHRTLETDLRLDADETTPKHLKELYCG